MAHSFQWIQASLGKVVALWMTRLILSVVHMHIARHSVRLDWIPFVWALNIFFLLMQFSWMFVELEPIVEKWSFGLFLALLGVVLTLFTASALVLPNTKEQAGECLQEWFERNGRYSLLFLTGYALLTYFFNWYLASQGPETNPAAGMLIVMSLVAFFTKSRKLLVLMTVLNLSLTLALVVQMVTIG